MFVELYYFIPLCILGFVGFITILCLVGPSILDEF